MRALVFCALVACGGSAPPPAATPPPAAEPAPTAAATPATPPATGSGATPDVEVLLAKVAGFKDKLCACPDSNCVQGVSDEMNTWAKDMEAKGMKEPHMTDDQTKRAAAIGDDIGKCIKRITNMGG